MKPEAPPSRSQVLRVAVPGMAVGVLAGVAVAVGTGWPWSIPAGIAVGVVLAAGGVLALHSIQHGTRAVEWLMIVAVVAVLSSGVLALVGGRVGQALFASGQTVLLILLLLHFRHLRRTGLGRPPDMTVLPFSLGANSTQGRLARGGRLTVSAEALTFTPHAFEQRLGGRDVTIARADVVDVGVEPRSADVLRGGLRRRLRLDLAGGGRQMFVVEDLDRLVERLRSWRGARPEPR